MGENTNEQKRWSCRESYSIQNKEIYDLIKYLLNKQIGFIYYTKKMEKNIINKCKKEMVGFESKNTKRKPIIL